MKNKGLLFWGELLPMRSSYDLNQNKINFSLNSSKSRPTWHTSSRLVCVLFLCRHSADSLAFAPNPEGNVTAFLKPRDVSWTISSRLGGIVKPRPQHHIPSV